MKKKKKKTAKRPSKKAAHAPKPEAREAALDTLGISDPASLSKEALESKARDPLLSAARLLGLKGASRLRKGDLVDGVFRALDSSGGREAPPLLENRTRSRAEFEAHRYDLTEREPPSPPPFIPWGYGRDRVRALPVDPDRLYVYWEVTDEGRERSRAGLGEGGTGAWLNLRIYDTTGRLFDGTNAHSYFDHRVPDGARQWFFDVGKPASDAFVEIGMKSHEGYFVRIARSGRVTFPRRASAPPREPQWLTVRLSSDSPALVSDPAPEGPVERRWPVLPASPSPPREDYSEVPTFETSLREEHPEIAIATEWLETFTGERTFEVDGRWHTGFGPWELVIHGPEDWEERRVIARWSFYRSFLVEGGMETYPAGGAERALGSSALLGASERRFRGASELRLGGASELVRRGASERRFQGASEKLFRGASDRRFRGGASGKR